MAYQFDQVYAQQLISNNLDEQSIYPQLINELENCKAECRQISSNGIINNIERYILLRNHIRIISATCYFYHIHHRMPTVNEIHYNFDYDLVGHYEYHPEVACILDELYPVPIIRIPLNNNRMPDNDTNN